MKFRHRPMRLKKGRLSTQTGDRVFEKRMSRHNLRSARPKTGEHYLGCNHHVMLCTGVTRVYGTRRWRLRILPRDYDVSGVSLRDGSRLVCSVQHCGVRPLGVQQVANLLEEHLSQDSDTLG